jgi:hypothetical protein
MIGQQVIKLASHKDVHKLVSYNVPKAGNAAEVGNNNSPFHKFEKAAYAFRNKAGRCVCLLEMNVRVVKNKRYFVRDVMIEFDFVILKSLLCKAGTNFGHLLEVVIIVNIKVLGSEYFPVEFFVLNFVSAKEIELGKNYLRNDKND